MNTAFILLAQYGAKAIVPIDVVCRDYFAPLTVPTLVRKISAGEIALPLVRMETSQKGAKGVHVADLAAYIDARRATAVGILAATRQAFVRDADRSSAGRRRPFTTTRVTQRSASADL
ncbi:hypothetical protein P3T22_001890 [Paraburkholderia sp. GAS348]